MFDKFLGPRTGPKTGCVVHFDLGYPHREASSSSSSMRDKNVGLESMQWVSINQIDHVMCSGTSRSLPLSHEN